MDGENQDFLWQIVLLLVRFGEVCCYLKLYSIRFCSYRLRHFRYIFSQFQLATSTSFFMNWISFQFYTNFLLILSFYSLMVSQSFSIFPYLVCNSLQFRQSSFSVSSISAIALKISQLFARLLSYQISNPTILSCCSPIVSLNMDRMAYTFRTIPNCSAASLDDFNKLNCSDRRSIRECRRGGTELRQSCQRGYLSGIVDSGSLALQMMLRGSESFEILRWGYGGTGLFCSSWMNVFIYVLRVCP